MTLRAGQSFPICNCSSIGLRIVRCHRADAGSIPASCFLFAGELSVAASLVANEEGRVQISPPAPDIMKFELSEEEQEKLAAWRSTHEEVYTGAIGGRYTYSFTPTSLGEVILVTDNVTGEELNLTDYESW